ncbi:MAG: hypothetical protein U1E73_07735 [Planctomycetota bacterium]
MPRTFLPFVSLAFVTAFAAAVGAQQLAYDGFGGGPLPDLNGSTGGTGWVSAWADGGTDPTAVAAAGLAYPGLALTPGAARTPSASGVYPATYYTRDFPVPAGATALYVSFLLRQDAGSGAWGGLSFGQYPYTMSVGASAGNYFYGLTTANGLGALASKPLVLGETTLVVVEIALTGGVTYSLHLDPAIGSPQPAFPAATYALGPVTALPMRLALDNATGFTTDEIRVGTTWAAVLPAGPAVWTDMGFAKPGIAGAPHLAGSGPFAAGTTSALQLGLANANAIAFLVVGFTAQNTPMLGGVLVPDPVFATFALTDGAGALQQSLVLPASAPAGLQVLFQYVIQDPVATFGWAASNGLRGITQ